MYTKAQIKILKRIVKPVKGGNNRNKAYCHTDKGYCVTDGVSLYVLDESIPDMEYSGNEKLMDIVFKQFPSPDGKAIIPQPTIREIKAWMKENGIRRDREPGRYEVEHGHFVNPVYLLDLMSVFKNCVLFSNGGALDPVYVVADNGWGLVLPIRPLPKGKW